MNYIDDLSVDDIPNSSTDTLLESLSLKIMEDSILQQIENGESGGRDFLGITLDKFRAIMDNVTDEEILRGIKTEIVEWCQRIIVAIINKYNLAYNGADEESLYCIDLVEALYHFFIIDREEYVNVFYNNYIDIHKTELIASMEIGGRSGDITTIANKKKGLDKSNIPILSNLDEVIRYITFNAGVSTDEFLNIIDDGGLYISSIIAYFDDCTLAGDFFNEYVEMGGYTDSIGLRNSIRVRLSV